MNPGSMDPSWSSTVAVLGAAVLAALAVTLLWEAYSRWRHGRALRDQLSRIRGSEEVGGESVAALLKEEREGPEWLSAVLERLPQLQDLEHLLEQSGLELTPGTYVLQILGSASAVGVGALAVGVPPEFAFVLAAAAGTVPYLYVRRKRSKRLAAFEEAFPDAIDLLGRSVRAGHALTTGLKVVADEVAEPVGGEFRRVFEEQKFGLPLRDSLLAMGDRIDLPDVHIFVTALLVQRETGGNLVESLQSLASVIRSRFKLRREIKTRTAQGRMTGYLLAAMPVFLGLLLYAINPEYMGVLIQEPAGRTALMVALAMQFVGYLFIRRIVNLDY